MGMQIAVKDEFALEGRIVAPRQTNVMKEKEIVVKMRTVRKVSFVVNLGIVKGKHLTMMITVVKNQAIPQLQPQSHQPIQSHQPTQFYQPPQNQQIHQRKLFRFYKKGFIMDLDYRNGETVIRHIVEHL